MRGHRRAIVVAVSAVVGLATGMVSVLLTGGHDRPDSTTSAATPATEPFAGRVLREWDARRSRAYAEGDGQALSRLYVAGSRTGAADRALLRSYRDRGLRVSEMYTQVLALTVREQTDQRLVVVVTDVLADAIAGDRAHARWALPHDRPTTRRVVLVRDHGSWLVAEAYAVD